MKKKIIIASNNENKVKEISYMLSSFNFNCIPQSYYKISSVKETGLSFIENAIFL